MGSTELLHRLDPEDFGRMQRLIHQKAAAAIQRHGGHLERVQGDGGCAYFGFPDASEDAAESGVACALEMVRDCSELESTSGPPLQLRVGVATGLVVVADVHNSSLPGSTEIIGITPALASRLQSEARPNSVVVAEDTYRLTGGAFHFEAIGDRHLKGFSEPVRLWRPTARRSGVDRFSAHRRVAAPLIGRDDELKLFRRRWQQARDDHGQVIFLQGEAGIGKSRLIAEFRHEVARGSGMSLSFQCQPRGNTRPLHPFLDRLKQEISAELSASAPDRESIRLYFHSRGSTITVATAEILEFLLASGTDDRGALLADLSAEEIRVRYFDTILEVLVTLSSPGPTLMVIEDIHWADTLTEAVIARLHATIENLPMLVIVTSRENVATDLLGDANVLPMALSRLTEDAISRLLDSIWPGNPAEGLSAFVHAKSDGVPLFAEELAHLLRERIKTDASGPSDWEAALREGQIVSLQDLIAARLSDLGPVRRIAQIAAVIGRDFALDLLSSMVETEDLPASIDHAIRELIRAGTVRRRASGSGCRFRHVLIQEAAYDSILKSDRRELHADIVRLVASGAVSGLSDETLAWHCAQAGQPLEAARYALRAAEACVVRSAVREADRLLDYSEEQLARSPAETQTTADLRLQLLTARGPIAAALFGRGSEQARAIYEEGVARSASRADEDRSKYFPLYWGWWFTAPDYETQRARSEILLRDLEGSADPEVRLQAYHCAWATNEDAGLHSLCLKCVEEGLRLYDEERALRSRGRYGGHDAKVCGLGERAFSLWFVGDEAGSNASMDEAMRWADHINHVESRVHALDYALGLRTYHNDYVGVIAVAEQLVSIGGDHALPGAIAKAKLFRGWARARTGDVPNGLAEFEEGFARQREIGTEENVSLHGGMRAEILEGMHRNEQAFEVIDATIAAAIRSGQLFWLAELYRSMARLRRAVAHAEEDVVADLRKALNVAVQQGAHTLAARARADMERFGLTLNSSN